MDRPDENLEVYHVVRSKFIDSIDNSVPDVEDVETKALSVMNENSVPELKKYIEIIWTMSTEDTTGRFYPALDFN